MINTNDKFWDCECDENHIHSKRQKDECSKCGTKKKEDQPDSRQNEVRQKLI